MRAAICLDYSRYFRGIIKYIAAGVNGAIMYYSARTERWIFSRYLSTFVLLES